MARPSHASANPALDAAGLLRRFGFAILVVGAPLLAVTSRRGLVVAAPLGIVLILLATAIETEGREPLTRFWRRLRSPASGVAVFLAFWAALSLLWTPFPEPAADRLLNLVGLGLVGLAAVSALPERMRVSNLYLLPIGAGAAALVALGLGWRALAGRSPDPETDRALIERGLLVILLLTPAAVTWLLSKERMASGFALVAAVTAALVVGESYAALVALILGAVVFAIATVNGRVGRTISLVMLPGLVMVAPAVPFMLRPLAKLAFGTTSPRVDAIRVWCRVITEEPLRLLTGYGLDTALRAKLAGKLPNAVPSGILFDIWFELGFLGATALALLLARAILATRRLNPVVAPGALMTLMVAFALAVMGLGAAQAWWLTSLVIGAIAILAVERGQYGTRRPKSGLAPPSSPRPAAPAFAEPSDFVAARRCRPQPAAAVGAMVEPLARPS